MVFSAPIRLLASLALITLYACNGQTQSNPKPAPDSEILLTHHPVQETDGVVYFSYDQGLTWENKSEGLPSTTSIGLGGIAVSGNQLALISKDSGLYYFKSQEDKWVPISTSKQLLEGNVGALLFYHDRLYAGTQTKGVFYSEDNGHTWATLNTGLDNVTIRKFAKIEDRLYVATNSGLYSYNDTSGRWELEYGNGSLQVNGLTVFDGRIYMATSQGGFASPIGEKDWKPIFSKGALHNISSDDQAVSAMAYNELFSSYDQGQTWQNIQGGLPSQLYTFNVVNVNHTLLAGQWDGIYRKDSESGSWKLSSTGLPEKLAIANMQVYDNIIVVTGNERKLRDKMTTGK